MNPNKGIKYRDKNNKDKKFTMLQKQVQTWPVDHSNSFKMEEYFIQ